MDIQYEGDLALTIKNSFQFHKKLDISNTYGGGRLQNRTESKPSL